MTGSNKDNLRNHPISLADGQTAEWLEKESKEYIQLMTYYRCAMMEIETKFRVLNEEYSLAYDRNPISTIKTRLKRPTSIREKLAKKGCPLTIKSVEENLNDVAGIRVVCPFIEDVYLISEALLKQDDVTLVRKKDYIHAPKPNGYRSLHLIVEIPIFLSREKRIMKAEIQLRTIAMDFWASVEHQLRYKKDFIFTEQMMKELFECATMSAELDARMDKLRQRLGE